MPPRKIKFNDLLVKIVADDRLTKAMKRVNKLIKGTAAIAAKSTAAIAAVGTGGLAIATAKSIEFGDTIARTSRQLDLSTNKFQEYFNAAKFADSRVDVEEFGEALKDVVERITEANTLGEGDLFDAARAAGLNTELRESGAIVDDLVVKFARLSEEDRIFRTRELVGDGAYEQLSGLLSLSTERLQGLIAESKKLGLIISPENLDNLSRAKKAMGALKQLTTAFGAEIAANIAPKLVTLTVWITEFIKANGGVGKFLDAVFDRLKFKLSELRVAIDALPLFSFDLTDDEKQLQRYTKLVKKLDRVTSATAFTGFARRRNAEAAAGLQAEIDQLKAKLPISPEFEFKGADISEEKIQAQVDLLYKAADVRANIPAKIDLESAGASTELKAAGESAAKAVADGFNNTVSNHVQVHRFLTEEQLCEAAEKAGSNAASCLTRAFQQTMENVESVIGTVGNVLGGIESLMSASESREVDRIARARARNTAELDMLKTRLQSAQTMGRAEVGLYNKQVAGVNARNRSLDIAAAAAEAKACKRAKRFAVLQGAVTVAASWAAAVKAGAFAAGAGPIAFFAGAGSVLSAGLAAAAQIAKFDCNKIGSTSGSIGGSGGGGNGPQFNPTQRAGADLDAFDPSRARQQQNVFNFNLSIDPITADIIVETVNESNAQINVNNVAGVF